MEHLPPVGWADVATRRDLDHLAAATKHDLDRLSAELATGLAEVRGELATGMAQMRSELATGLAGVRGEIGDVRVELHAQLRSVVAANLATMTALCGLVIAAGKLF